MKNQLKIWFLLTLMVSLTGCYTTNLAYNNPQKISENVYEFQNPRYSYTPTYTGVSVFCASIIGVTAYSVTNPWFSLENRKSPAASAVVGVSGVFITTALIKVLFYSNNVIEGEEQKWLDNFKYKLSFINATYGKVLSSSTFLGTHSATREVIGIQVRLIPPTDPNEEHKIYDFEKMFIDDKSK